MTNNATDLITIEAEDLDFDNDFIVSQIDASASGGKILRVRSDRRDAKATTTFNGPDGVYDFTLHAYDENDGQGQLKIWINGELANRTILSQNLGSNLANGQTKGRCCNNIETIVHPFASLQSRAASRFSRHSYPA